MSEHPTDHLVERAVRRMRTPRAAGLGTAPSRVDLSGASAPALQQRPSVTIETLSRAGAITVTGRRTRAGEEWQIVAQTLQRRQLTVSAGSLGTALMVTSSRPREGKSYCSLNLAVTMAQGGRSDVLLVDVDEKPGNLTDVLGLADRPGLHDLMTDRTLDPLGVITPTAVKGLDLLTIGRGGEGGGGTGNGATGRMQGCGRDISRDLVTILDHVARQQPDRLLILDTAPCLASSDAASLAPHVGQIVMIVEAERTQQGELESAIGLLSTCETISLVLNKARTGTTGHFGSYYDLYGKGW
ncbi:hypothetical protein [Lichenicola sp.]|uniref:hypothetical protein n=1 Tax=Lichenicola sp. TaxID=2804529 RepID=UPI003B0018A9